MNAEKNKSSINKHPVIFFKSFILFNIANNKINEENKP